MLNKYRVEFSNGQHMTIMARSPNDALIDSQKWYGLPAVCAELLKGKHADGEETNQACTASVNS